MAERTILMNNQEHAELILSTLREVLPDTMNSLAKLGYDLTVVWNSHTRVVRADKDGQTIWPSLESTGLEGLMDRKETS